MIRTRLVTAGLALSLVLGLTSITDSQGWKIDAVYTLGRYRCPAFSAPNTPSTIQIIRLNKPIK